jgi:hypothetical protein
MKKPLYLILSALTIGSVSAAFAFSPTLVVECHSGAKTLRVLRTGNRYSVSMTEPMTREKIVQDMFHGKDPGDVTVNTLLKLPIAEQIPAGYLSFSKFEYTSDVPVKNAFLLSEKQKTLRLIRDDQNRIVVETAESTQSRKQSKLLGVSSTSSESSSTKSTYILGPLETVSCELPTAP